MAIWAPVLQTRSGSSKSHRPLQGYYWNHGTDVRLWDFWLCEHHSWSPHMWDPRLMCLKECLDFILEVWVSVCCVNMFYSFCFCKWQYQWSVSLLSSRVYEVAKAATLWLFSHGEGGVEWHGDRGISNIEYVEIVRACVHVMSIEQSQWSCELLCRTTRVQHIP